MAKIYSFMERGRNMLAQKETYKTDISSVAKTFLSIEPMTHKKLQKLCYYAYAWHLTLFETPLFKEKFQAWVHGPVSPELYQQYKTHGWREIPQLSDFSIANEQSVIDIIESVYASYGHLSGDELEILTHEEDPWLVARNGLPDHAPSQATIEDEVITRFYNRIFEFGQND
ncbi:MULTISPECIES: Panacea domain-containing protein [Bacillus amyloliquefaciens group]|uniref:Panacea domain-containing protein n=1 Tax=Bacillus amyloliquefaciens group TaxID=1938374 RepID=UPI0022B7A237|nr:type II toxin-antitoxin system antitoxin SocA domain-containing protein [Bacillus siamensis]MDU0814638.1 DUF4065 domain-containing protein [Bacillus siamensis]